MKKHLIAFILIFLVPHLSHATGQVGDVLKCDGEIWKIMGSPLEAVDTSIFGPFQRYIENPDSVGTVTVSTGCWRGFVGTWSVKDGYLYLDSLQISSIPDETESIELAKRFFRRYLHDGRIRADWLSGETFRIQKGSVIRYQNDGYSRACSCQKFMTVSKGIVSFSRQFGENPSELGMSPTHLLGEWISAFLPTIKHSSYFHPRSGAYSAILYVSLKEFKKNEYAFIRCYVTPLNYDNPTKCDTAVDENLDGWIAASINLSPWRYKFIKDGKIYITDDSSRGFGLILSPKAGDEFMVLTDTVKIEFTL